MVENPPVPEPGSVVVGMDGSVHSTAALEWAAQQAVLQGRPLHVAHVFLPMIASGPWLTGPLDTGQQAHASDVLSEAERHVRDRHPALEVTSSLHTGRIASSLIALGKHAGLIVVGHRGHGGFDALRLGSVAVQVSAHAPCPVAVVRHPSASNGRVIVGVDLGGGSDAAVTYAFEMAASRGRGLTAVHTWLLPAGAGDNLPAVTDIETINTGEDQLLADVLANWQRKYPTVDVRRYTHHGTPAKVLTDLVADGADALVVGSRGHGGFVGLLLGSVSQAVLHHAQCPVIVVPEAGAAHRQEGVTP